MELSGVFFGILAMIGLGMSTAFAREPIKSFGSAKTIFLRNIYTTTILFVVLMFFWDTAIFSAKYIAIGVILALFGYIPFFLFYKAIGVGKMGVVNPIANSAVVFTVLFSVLIYGETLTMLELGAIALIVAGIFFISVNLSDMSNSDFFSVSSGVPYAMATCVLWGLSFTLAKIPSAALGGVLSAFVCEATTLLVGGLVMLRNDGISMPSADSLKKVGLVGVFATLGTLAYFAGISSGNVSIVAAIAFSNPLVTYAYTRIAWGERLSSLQNAAMGMIIVGIIVISYF